MMPRPGACRLLCLLLVATMLAGCGAPRRAVVVERSSGQPSSRTTPREPPRSSAVRGREYVVVRGDTLYGIAFRQHIDFNDLARWNRIGAPYTIYPGQRLMLAPGPGIAATPPRPARTEPQPQASRAPTAVTPAPTAAAPANPNPPPAVAAPVAPAAPFATPPRTSPDAPTAARSAGGVSWRWPATGQLVSRFAPGDPTRQGINLAGDGGQPVFASAAGEVVYSGSGLIGYGELIIIKHSDVYLSAYGHNRKRLVAEGQRVSAGQQIAEMGRTGASRDMLHFEVRKNGKPVDPLPLLPSR